MKSVLGMPHPKGTRTLVRFPSRYERTPEKVGNAETSRVELESIPSSGNRRGLRRNGRNRKATLALTSTLSPGEGETLAAFWSLWTRSCFLGPLFPNSREAETVAGAFGYLKSRRE